MTDIEIEGIVKNISIPTDDMIRKNRYMMINIKDDTGIHKCPFPKDWKQSIELLPYQNALFGERVRYEVKEVAHPFHGDTELRYSLTLLSGLLRTECYTEKVDHNLLPPVTSNPSDD
jgi:hypothetical protein